MPVKPERSKEYFKSINSMYIGLLISMVLMDLFVLKLHLHDQLKVIAYEYNKYIAFVLAVVMILTVGINRKNFNKKILLARRNKKLVLKMSDYRRALIVRFAVLLLAAFTSLIGFYFTGEIIFWALSGYILVIYLTLIPGRKRAKNDLELNDFEFEQINDPNAVICEISSPR